VKRPSSPLLATNPYLTDPAKRRRIFEDTVITSSAVEGVRLTRRELRQETRGVERSQTIAQPEMNRRGFLGMIAAIPIGVSAGSAMPSVRRLRLKSLDGPGLLHRAAVWDADTGEDVTRRFPISAAPALDHSWRTGRPVRIEGYALKDGKPVVAGNHILIETMDVVVVAWDRRP